ncbi:MAG: thioredoxin [Bacteroidota bacterium]
MKPIIITDANFEQEVLQSNLPVLIDFWADWCAPCKMVAPIVEELAKDYEGKLKVGKLDVDANPKVSMKYGIRSIPTLLVFRSGHVVEQIIGAVPKHHLVDKVSSHVESAA